MGAVAPVWGSRPIRWGQRPVPGCSGPEFGRDAGPGGPAREVAGRFVVAAGVRVDEGLRSGTRGLRVSGFGVAGLGGRLRGGPAATGCCSSVCGSCGFRGVASPEPAVAAQHVRGCDGTSSGRSPRSSLCCCLVGETGEIAASNEPRPMLSPCMLLGYQRSPRRPSNVRSLQSNRLVGTLDGSQEPVNGLPNIACPTPETHRKRGTHPTGTRRWTLISPSGAAPSRDRGVIRPASHRTQARP